MPEQVLALPRLVLGMLVFGAIGWQLRIHVSLQYAVINFFSYFTNLANMLAAAVFVIGARRTMRGQLPSATFEKFRFMAVVNMTIVGIVFSLLLRNVDLGSLLPWINLLLHYIMPVVLVVDWLIDPPSVKLTMKDLLRIEILPIVYLAYVLVRGAQTEWYPYPFLNPAVAGGYSGVAGYAVGITVVFVVVGWMLVKLGNRKIRASRV